MAGIQLERYHVEFYSTAVKILHVVFRNVVFLKGVNYLKEDVRDDVFSAVVGHDVNVVDDF